MTHSDIPPPFKDLTLKDKLLYFKVHSIPAHIQAYVLGIEEDTVKEILVRNGWYGNTAPNSKPDGYYISRLEQGMTVKEIAEDLECTRATVYRLLKRRGISLELYR